MASLARAFTLRRKKADSTASKDDTTPPVPARAASMRFSENSVDIKKISGPVQLLSTTNMLTYNAPDVSIVQAQRKASSSVSSGSSNASRPSEDGSDASSISNRSRGTVSTDVSSVENSPSSSPQTDKKTHYFENTPAVKGSPTLRRSISTLEIRHHSFKEETAQDLLRSESPAIPMRHPSHSKKASMELARKRSMHGISRANSISSIISTQKEVRRTSLDFFNGKAHDSSSTPEMKSHPFGPELEQLAEVAEEFTGAINDAEKATDLRIMKQRGLVRFCADDYLAEIEPLFGGMFGHSNRLTVPAMAWI